jgi:hypothetical protein
MGGEVVEAASSSISAMLMEFVLVDRREAVLDWRGRLRLGVGVIEYYKEAFLRPMTM